MRLGKTKIRKTLETALPTALGVAHVVLLVLFLAPANPMTNYYKGPVSNYIKPIFTQNWKLFAPDPQPFSLKMYYRCSGSATWIDPIEPILKKHQRFRVGPNGKILYVYHSMIRELMNYKVEICMRSPEQGCLNPISNSKVKGSEFYKNMHSYIKGFCPGRFHFKAAQLFSYKYSDRNKKEKRRTIRYDLYEGH